MTMRSLSLTLAAAALAAVAAGPAVAGGQGPKAYTSYSRPVYVPSGTPTEIIQIPGMAVVVSSCTSCCRNPSLAFGMVAGSRIVVIQGKDDHMMVEQ